MQQAISTAGTEIERQQLEEADLVGHYLRRIGRTALLNAHDEVELAKSIEAGLYAAELLRQHEAGQRPLSAEHREELAELVREGRRAKETMINANLRLVVSVAKKYLRRGLPLADLIQEGNLGLIRAVEKFDYRRGYKFSTYAMWWIRQAITRGLADQTRTVRLPVHMVEQLNKVERLERDLEMKLNREPTVEETAEAAGIPASRVEELHQAARDAASLDLPVGEDGDTSIGSLIEDTDATTAMELVEQRAFSAELRRLLRHLPERESNILALRYGLLDGNQHTLQEVADQLGITRERVRQLEKKALAQLRSPELREPLTAWAS